MSRLNFVVPVVLILVGGLWVLQGAGFVGGSFMTGDSNWLNIGLAVAALGVVLLVLRLRRR